MNQHCMCGVWEKKRSTLGWMACLSRWRKVNIRTFTAQFCSTWNNSVISSCMLFSADVTGWRIVISEERTCWVLSKDGWAWTKREKIILIVRRWHHHPKILFPDVRKKHAIKSQQDFWALNYDVKIIVKIITTGQPQMIVLQPRDTCVCLWSWPLVGNRGRHWWEMFCWVGSSISTVFPLCLFKLPVTFPATRLFHTGWPNGYRGGQPLLQQNRRLLSVEELVKLHFSMKVMFSEEAAVVLFFL